MDLMDNVKKTDIADLIKSKFYGQEITDCIVSKNLSKLKTIINEGETRNMNFMYPLLYAVKNDYNTYYIYKLMGENLQIDQDLGMEVALTEPKLLAETPLSSDKEFLLKSSERNGKVLEYMSTDLKEDVSFLIELNNSDNPEVTYYANKSLEQMISKYDNIETDKDLIQRLIISDVQLMKYVNPEIKGDSEFIEQMCKTNENVINYIADNTKEFNKEGLNKAKSVLVEISTSEAINSFEEEKKDITGEKHNDIENSKRNKQLNRHIDFMKKIERGEVDSVRAAKLMKRLCKNLDEKTSERLENLLKIEDGVKLKNERETKNTIDKVDNRDLREDREGEER